MIYKWAYFPMESLLNIPTYIQKIRNEIDRTNNFISHKNKFDLLLFTWVACIYSLFSLLIALLLLVNKATTSNFHEIL